MPNAKAEHNPTKSNAVIVEDEVHIARTQTISSDEVGIARWSFVLAVACEHALNTQTYALHTLDRRPALAAEQVQADDAIGVDVGMHGDISS